MLSKESNLDMNSDLGVSVKPDTSEPSAPRAHMDSVTAVLAVQKQVTRNQSWTKLKHLCRSCTNNFLTVLLDTGSDGDLMFHKTGSFSLLE